MQEGRCWGGWAWCGQSGCGIRDWLSEGARLHWRKGRDKGTPNSGHPSQEGLLFIWLECLVCGFLKALGLTGAMQVPVEADSDAIDGGACWNVCAIKERFEFISVHK